MQLLKRTILLFKPKFIELTSREKMCSLDLKMEVNTNKKRLLNISRSKTNAATIEKIKADDFKFTNIKPMTRGYGKIIMLLNRYKR
jgi:hypothetical protein